jgi:hypothetical protein
MMAQEVRVRSERKIVFESARDSPHRTAKDPAACTANLGRLSAIADRSQMFGRVHDTAHARGAAPRHA